MSALGDTDRATGKDRGDSHLERERPRGHGGIPTDVESEWGVPHHCTQSRSQRVPFLIQSNGD